MNEKHYKKEISAYLNHELPKEERQKVAEHLLRCDDCRKEHDEIKFGAALASRLPRAGAPPAVWNKIEKVLGEKEKTPVSFFSRISFFNFPAVAVAALLIGISLTAVIYFDLAGNQSRQMTQNEPAIQTASETVAQTGHTPGEILTNQTAANFSPSVQIETASTNANVQILPKIEQPRSEDKPDKDSPAPNNPPAWNVEMMADNQRLVEKGKLTVGEFLETDTNSRARVEVADIGQVEIAPNSRVRLVNTSSKEHRLSLTRGALQAKIFAPPRLFIVDTPSAVAVDLGCEYTLEVDREGNSRLHVTSGYVALERDGRESIVPAGAICLTKKGAGLGTPFSEDASAEFQTALFKFDFEAGGSDALQTIIRESKLYDALTLWHLLWRVPRNERGKVFDALAAHIEPPAGVTRDGALRLNKKMLDDWWIEIENVWFE